MKKLKFIGFIAFIIAAVATVFTNTAHAEHIGNAVLATVPFMAAANQANYRTFMRQVMDIVGGIPGGGFIVSPGTIRSELAISNSTTTYNFATRDQSLQSFINTFPLSKGVLDNDLIIGYLQMLTIDYRTNGSGAVVPQTYASYSAFTASGATPADLNVFYNGLFSVQNGPTKFVDQQSTQIFRTVPGTQKSSSQNENEFDLFDCGKDLGRPIFSGKADTTVSVQLNGTVGTVAATTGSTTNVLTYWCQGAKIVNGANFTLPNGDSLMNYISARLRA